MIGDKPDRHSANTQFVIYQSNIVTLTWIAQWPENRLRLKYIPASSLLPKKQHIARALA